MANIGNSVLSAFETLRRADARMLVVGVKQHPGLLLLVRQVTQGGHIDDRLDLRKRLE